MKEQLKAGIILRFCMFVFLSLFVMDLQWVDLRAAEEEEHATKQILLIQSYHQGSASTDHITDQVVNGLDDLYPLENDKQLYIEYLDLLRKSSDQQKETMDRYLEDKYANVSLDGIILVGFEAVDFAQVYLSDMVEDIPTIHVGVDVSQIDGFDTGIIMGRPYQIPFKNMLMLAKDLNPNLKKINIIVEDSVDMSVYEASLKEESDALNLVYQVFDERHVDTFINRMDRISDPEAVFMVGTLTEDYGDAYIDEVLTSLENNARVPVYVTNPDYVTKGALGAVYWKMDDYMKANLQILSERMDGSGAKLTSLNGGILTARYIVDYEAMKILGYDLNKLPEHTEIIEKPSIISWVMNNSLEILIVILAFLLLIFLFAFINVLLRFKAEKERESTRKDLMLSYMELEAAHEQLVASEGELTRQFNELQQKEDELRMSRERYRLAARGSEFGIWDYDTHTNRLYLSVKAKEILGYDRQRQSFGLEDLMELLNEEQSEAFKELVEDHVMGRSRAIEYQLILKEDGEPTAWISIRGKAQFREDGSVSRMAGSIIDITQEHKAQEHIREIAYTDDLTGLRNRAYYNERIGQVRHPKIGSNMAILLLDMDNFKTINDSLGHDFGDGVIIYVGSVLKKVCGNQAEVIRLGGDEYVLLMEDVQRVEDVRKLGEAVHRAFEETIILDKIALSITISMGAALYPLDCQTPDKLLKQADMALYDAKANGKNQLSFFTRDIEDKMIESIWYERELRTAIEEEQFELYYQPKVSLKKQATTGFEALIRWHHPERGIISPAQFIPVAEDMGLIIPIGQWVIKEAIKQLAAWHGNGHKEITMSINLSPLQFKDSQLLTILMETIDHYGVQPQMIELEITETAALQDVDHAIYLLQTLRDLGFRIALDDFGTGYSSLNYLSVLPIDTLKIDKTFIADAMTIKANERIIKTVIQLAHAYDMEVVAEGVETLSQLTFLSNEQCDIIQGYYIAKPLPAHEASLKIVGFGDLVADLQL